MPRPRTVPWSCVSVLLLLGCASTNPPTDERNNDADRDARVPEDELPGEELSFEVAASARTLIDLDELRVLDSDAGVEAMDWDLAFIGWDVFTNSGPSGPGNGASFGPLSQESFLFDTIPEVPFIRADATGGAFMDWYAYDGANHQLWSKYDVYGVRAAGRLFKLQISSYYGEIAGAPVSGLYQLRYAEVTESGVSPTKEISNLDATAGYPKVTSETPSGCLSLSSGDISSLTPAQALASRDWDLCFRRDAISVNGEQGGPADVTAARIAPVSDADASLETIQSRTADSELARFDSIGYPELTDPELEYRGDHVFSQFGHAWYEGRGEDAKPADATWLVVSADGEQHHSLLFRSIHGNADSAGQVSMRVQKLREPN